MIAWEDIVLEEDDEIERTRCDCCRGVTTRITGYLWADNDMLGWYSATFSEHGATHPPVITHYVGDWSEGAARDARWGMRVLWHAKGCTLLDWDDDRRAGITSFTPLDRGDVIGTPYADHLWAMTDAVIMKDTRLREVSP